MCFGDLSCPLRSETFPPRDKWDLCFPGRFSHQAGGKTFQHLSPGQPPLLCISRSKYVLLTSSNNKQNSRWFNHLAIILFTIWITGSSPNPNLMVGCTMPLGAGWSKTSAPFNPGSSILKLQTHSALSYSVAHPHHWYYMAGVYCFGF